MTEHNKAILIAIHCLCKKSGNPDSDQRILARQYLRAVEQVEALRSYATTPSLEYDY